ncbi:MAG TPA: hypothetical protein VMG10_12995 [Gemmataceae bacterium]|nr:hypothetical protein [Gemmataceae bacterium]
MGDESEPITDDEWLYRRVPASTGWYSHETGLKPEAFAPHKTEDATGLSISRAKFKTIAEAAKGRPGKSYYVAILSAGDLQKQGIVVASRPLLPNDPGHAELPDLNSSNRKTAETLERQRILVSLCLRVEGPFATAEE